MLNRMNFLNSQNKSVNQIFDDLRRDNADKDKQLYKLENELRDFKENNNPQQFINLKKQLEDVTKELIKKEQQCDLMDTNKGSIEQINE